MLWFVVGVIAILVFVFFAARSTKPATWVTSENGNQTRLYRGSRVTVFSSDGGWKYCISAPFGDDDPYFSDPYSTQEEAMACGVAFLEGSPDPHKTRREMREGEQLRRALDETSSSTQVLSDLADAFDVMHSSGRFLVKDITAIKRTADRQKRALVEVYKHHYIDDRDEDAAHTWQMRENFGEISDHCDALLIWLRSASKAERGEPPAFHSPVSKSLANPPDRLSP